jgi:DNA-directed RNA polymerase subunit RPC12/RpoP
MKEYFCWRCNKKMPFLEEYEWKQVSPLLEGAIKAIKDYRSKHHCDLTTAKDNCKPEATRKFEDITGMPNIHFETIYHHRLADWGQECPKCGYLLRTPKAKFCANCGWLKNNNA